MNALQMAQNAYASTGAPIRTERGNEGDIIARVTHDLKRSDPKKNFKEFVTALHQNRQMWILLAVDVASEENGLPQDLRAQIFYLYEFTMDRTSRILAGSATADSLIEVNTAILRGLRHQEGTS
ncbi:MAG: flagellar biosynthesis regulator FlaF [Marinosulfonomonas sp.]